VVANGPKTKLKMFAGEVVGDGPSGGVVQNGVQIGLGAKGKIGATSSATSRRSSSARRPRVSLLPRDARTVRGVSVRNSQTGVFVAGRALVQGNKLDDLVGDGVILMGDSSHLFGNDIDGAGVSAVFVSGNRNVVRFGFIANTPVGVWMFEGERNSFSGINFDDSVPLQGRASRVASAT
jgi:hypothetical protein